MMECFYCNLFAIEKAYPVLPINNKDQKGENKELIRTQFYYNKDPKLDFYGKIRTHTKSKAQAKRNIKLMI